MRRLLLPVLAAWLVAAAPTLSSDELAELAAGDTIVRNDDLPGGGTEIVAVTDSKASADALLDAVLDLPPRADDVGVISKIEVYENTPTRVAAEMQLTIVGTVTAFHVVYDVDRAAHKATFALDPTRENDIESLAGSYEVLTLPDGTNRLVYRGVVEKSGYVPQWLRSKLEQGPLIEQMQGIRRRAEK
jgi:hypothetical protein